MLQLQRLQIRLFRAVHLRLRPLQTAFFLLLVILFQLLLPLITRSQIQLIPVTLPLQMLSVHRHQTSIILRIRQRTSSILRAQIFHTLLALLVQLLFQRSTLLSFTLQEWVSSLSTTATMSRAVSSAVGSTAATIASTPIIIQIERVNPLFARCQCQLRQVIDVLLSLFQAMKRTAERILLRLQFLVFHDACRVALRFQPSRHSTHRRRHIHIHHRRLVLIRMIPHLILHSLHITLFAFHHQFRILLSSIRLPQLILQRLHISLILQLFNVSVYRLRIVVDEFPRLLQRRMIFRHQTLQLQQSLIPLLIRESLILHASTQLVYLCHLLRRLAVSLLRRTRYLALQSRLAFRLLVRFALSIRQVTSPRLQQRHHTQQRRQPSHQPSHRRHRHHSVQATHRQSRQRHRTRKQPLHSRSHSSSSRPRSASNSSSLSRHSVQRLHHKVTLLPYHQDFMQSNHPSHRCRQYRQLHTIASSITNSRHQCTTCRHHAIQQRHIDRRQLLPQLHTHIRKLLLRLLQLSLQRIVRLVILIRHARPLAVSLCSLRLSRTHQVQIVRKRRQSLRHTSPRQVHLLQHRSHVLHAPMRFQRRQKLHHSSIRIRLEGFGKLLDVETRYLRHLCRIAKQSTKHILQRRRTLFHTHHRLIQHTRKPQDVRLRDLCRVRHTRQSSRKFQQIRLRCRTALCQIIDRRCRRQHPFLQSHARICGKELRDFPDVFHSILTQILTQSHRDLIRSVHEVQHILLALDAQSSSVCSQIIQRSTRRASVQALKTLIQIIHSLRRQSSIFDHPAHVLLHLRKLIHILTHRRHRTLHCTNHRIYRSARHTHSADPLFTHTSKSLDNPLLFLKSLLFVIQIFEFSLRRTDSVHISIPLLAPTFHCPRVQRLVDFLDRVAQLFRSRLVQTMQHRLQGFHPVHILFQLPLLHLQFLVDGFEVSHCLPFHLIRGKDVSERLLSLCFFLLQICHMLAQLIELLHCLRAIHLQLEDKSIFLCHTKKIVSMVLTPKIRL